MSSNSSDGNSFSGSDGSSEGNTGISKLFLSLDLQGETADSVLNSILVRHLTPSELRGAPIGCKRPSLTPKNTMALLNAQVKASNNTIMEKDQQQQHKSATSTVLETKTRAPISSFCDHMPAKRGRFSPKPEAERNFSSESDSETLNLPLAGSSQTDSSPSPSLEDEILPTPEFTTKLSPGQLRSKTLKAQMKRRAKVQRSFKRLHSLRPHLLRFRKRKTRSRHDRMHRACTNYMTFLAGKYGVLKERFDKLQMQHKMVRAKISSYYFNLPNKGPVINIEDMRRLYEQHVRSRTQNNWKFWILGFIMDPLLTSYNSRVSCNDFKELSRTSLAWLSKDYSFMGLRSALTDKIAYLSVTTNLLADTPSTLPEEVARALNNARGQHPHLYGRI